MVKLIGPMHSTRAQGTLASLLNFQHTKGRHTLRKKPVPKQPRSGLQVSMRAILTFLSQQWTTLTAGQKVTWQAIYPGTELSAYNAYLKHNLERWRRREAPSKAYPPAEAGAAGFFSNLTAAGGSRNVVLGASLTLALNDNWLHFLFHSAAATPAPDVANLVHVFLQDAMPAVYWTHTPLAPGTHYYRICPGTDDGNPFFHISDTASAVVT